MMTGLYPSAHGLRWNTEAKRIPGNRTDFASSTRLYSHWLSEAGYRNAYVGKWHCGHDRLPVDYGIEGWSLPDYGAVYSSDAYEQYAAGLGLGEARILVEHNVRGAGREGKTHLMQGRHQWAAWDNMDCSGVLQGPPEAHEGMFVAHLAIEKLKELTSAGDQPFSLVASFWGPHHAYCPAERYAGMIDPRSIPKYPSFDDDCRGKPLRHLIHRDLVYGRMSERWDDWSVWQEVLARCYEQQIQLDAAIGTLLDAVDNLGISENTMVIWVADHGDAVASHGALWDKASTFTEEVARVPMAIRWGRELPAGEHTGSLVSNMDATATMLDAAGVAVPASMHSRSLLPLGRDLTGHDWADQVICEHSGHCEPNEILQRIVVTERYKYVAAVFDGDELYDLQEDPHEMKNLIDSDEHADVSSQMRTRLVEHIEGTEDKLAARRLLYVLRRG
jgi:arylsulfatase A-like enzyme